MVAAILAFIIACMRRFRISAATRHTLWLLAFAKFAVPSSLLWSAGTSLASLITFHPTLQIPVIDFSRLLQNASAHTTLTSAVPGYAWVTILLASVWVAGSLLAFANWIQRLSRSTVSMRPASEPLQNALIHAKQQLSIRENVKVAISNETTEPVAIGIWRPVVVLPEPLANSLSAGELNAVLLHELAHVARRDNLTGSLTHLIWMMFWFHPLLGWMERQLSMDCEYACDEVVLATARTPADYVSGILKATRFAFGCRCRHFGHRWICAQKKIRANYVSR